MNSQRLTALCDDRLKQLTKHELVVVVDTFHNPTNTRIVIARLCTPGTRIMSTQITFTNEGVAIQGDFTPGRENGCCSHARYGVDWFTSDLSPDYLASKFLKKEFTPEAAIDEVRDLAEQYPQHKEALLQAISDESDVFCDATRFHDWLETEFDITLDEFPYDYPEQAVADLCAIQRKFAELWGNLAKFSGQRPQCF